MQINRSRPTAHPQRVALHNEIHARPPEAMSAPLAISHIVMVGDAQEREASRAHVAALLRDHHLPQPDAQSTHIRMDLGAFRIRWELHTEFVTWSFSRPIEAAGFGEREPATAHRRRAAGMAGAAAGPVPGQPAPVGAADPGLRQRLAGQARAERGHAGRLHGGRWPWRGLHRLRAARRRLLAHGAAGRAVVDAASRLGRWCSGCWRSTPIAWPPCWACRRRARRPPCWPMPSANWPNWPAAIRVAGRDEEPQLLDRLTKLAGQVESQYARDPFALFGELGLFRAGGPAHRRHRRVAPGGPADHRRIHGPAAVAGARHLRMGHAPAGRAVAARFAHQQPAAHARGDRAAAKQPGAAGRDEHAPGPAAQAAGHGGGPVRGGHHLLHRRAW